MSAGLIRSSHSVGEANYHLQFTAAYRCGIFRDELVRILTRDYLLAAAKRHGITVSAIGFGPDHCHMFTAACKNHSPSRAANLLKGFSSFMMRKHHRDLFIDRLWGKKFWTGGYFYRTVGAVNAETVKRYVVEEQGKHWEDRKQTKLIEFTAN